MDPLQGAKSLKRYREMRRAREAYPAAVAELDDDARQLLAVFSLVQHRRLEGRRVEERVGRWLRGR